jgi:hypothetical protein
MIIKVFLSIVPPIIETPPAINAHDDDLRVPVIQSKFSFEISLHSKNEIIFV